MSADEIYGRDAKHFKQKRDEYNEHIKPELTGKFAATGEDDPEYIAHNAPFGTETGHLLNVQPPMPPDHQVMPHDDEWYMNVSHPNTTNAITGQRVNHRENLGNDAKYVQQRVKEFMVGRHGMSVMRDQANGTYGQQDGQ
jgi:hypothetical protein